MITWQLNKKIYMYKNVYASSFLIHGIFFFLILQEASIFISTLPDLVICTSTHEACQPVIHPVHSRPSLRS